VKKLLTIVALAGFGLNAFAVGPDFSTLTSAVDFTTVSSAILAIALLIVPVYVVWKGAKLVLRSIKGM
jgi:hypothetical protein